MSRRVRNEAWWLSAILLLTAVTTVVGDSVVLHLKNGDRLTGKILSETTNSVSVATPFLGTVQVPLAEVGERELIIQVDAATNTVASTTNQTPAAAAAPVPKPGPPRPPLTPTNPEATSIAATPNFWKHDLRFGMNMRYAAKDSQEILLLAKSTYGKPPFRHIFEANFKYGKIEGVVSANSVLGSEKTEYQLGPKTYLFNLVGGGFDEIRHIDAQFDFGPGVGLEVMKTTNFVWKSEVGLNFQQQYRSDDTQLTSYSARIAEIFAWRVWGKLTADTKIEFFPNLAQFGEYRLRLEANLRYPVSNRLSLNLDLIDTYDTRPPQDVSANDVQIRSTIGVNF